MKIFKVGVVQSTPVFFDNEATLEKTERIVAEQAADGVKLLLFPESYLPGYPRGFDFATVVGSRGIEGRATWQTYWEQSIAVDDHHCRRLAEMAARFAVFLVIGITERDETRSTLYCTLLYFDPVKGLVHRHRKLKPTGSERLIWGEGKPEAIGVIQTPFGSAGGLICWENLMPRARLRLYELGIHLYLAPTADARPTWTAILQHIAQESRCYVLGANQYFRVSDYPEPWRGQVNLPEDCCRGGSVIVSPLGELLAGPLWDTEGVLTAELDPGEVIRSRFDFSVVGHYAKAGL